MQAKAKYGLHDASTGLYSILAFSGDDGGTRISADRLYTPHARYTGASKRGTGTNRLYEFTLGVATAAKALACSSRPPMKFKAYLDKPCSDLMSEKRLLPLSKPHW